MNFPLIEHIDQVLPHVQGRPDFVVAEREGYTVIDYVFAASDTFDDPICRECRGITFDRHGEIIRRPFNKFFNIGEKEETQPHRIDFLRAHDVTLKMDGSMIAPAIVDDELVLMTRMGRTDVARKAETILSEQAADAMIAALEDGITPVFEFTAPDNRIVIRYERPELTLLAARSTCTGKYLDAAAIDNMACDMGLPLVQHFPSTWSSAAEFMAYARAVTGMEGFVVRFADGLWLKAKGEDYVLKHKAKDSVLHEKNVLAMILGGQIDDVLPLLEDEDRNAILAYQTDVLLGIDATAEEVQRIVDGGASLDQKTFAVEHLRDVPKDLRSIAFTVRAGRDVREAVVAAIAKGTGTQAAVDAARNLHRGRWNAGVAA